MIRFTQIYNAVSIEKGHAGADILRTLRNHFKELIDEFHRLSTDDQMERADQMLTDLGVRIVYLGERRDPIDKLFEHNGKMPLCTLMYLFEPTEVIYVLDIL